MRAPYLLTVGNLQAQADAWAVISHTGQMRGRHSLAFVSCVAPPTVSKGIRAILNSSAGGSHAALMPPLGEQDRPVIWRAGLALLSNHRRYSASLPELKLRHDIYLSAGAPPEHKAWTLVCRDPQHAPRRYLELLTRHTPVIALPEWADAIWEIALAREWVIPMTGYGIWAWQCLDDAAAIQDDISDLLAHNRLPIPEPNATTNQPSQ